MRREQVERCLSTTMTIKNWCALNGVPESTMYGWMSRFRKEEPELFEKPNASEWIEVTREAIAAQTALAKPRASVVAKAEAGNTRRRAGRPCGGARRKRDRREHERRGGGRAGRQRGSRRRDGA